MRASGRPRNQGGVGWPSRVSQCGYIGSAPRSHGNSSRTVAAIRRHEARSASRVSRQTINSIETERYTPSLPLALALSQFFEKPVEEVFHVNGAL